MPGGVIRVADALQTQEVPSSPRAQSTRDGSSVPRKSGWIVVNEDLQRSPPEFPCSLQVGRPSNAHVDVQLWVLWYSLHCHPG